MIENLRKRSGPRNGLYAFVLCNLEIASKKWTWLEQQQPDIIPNKKVDNIINDVVIMSHVLTVIWLFLNVEKK